MEITNKKENQFTYFKFFFSALKLRMLLAISMNILIGLLDGLGITMLFPLLQSVEKTSDSKETMGHLNYVLTAFEYMGLPLTINVILLIFLGLFVIKGIVKYLASIYQSKIQRAFIKKIQFGFVKDIRYISYKGFLQLDAGYIQNAMTSEVWRVLEAMKSYLRWSNSLFMLLTYVFMAYLANVKFALLITVGVSIINLFYRNISKKIKAISYETSMKGRKLTGYMIEILHHFKYLKSTNYLNLYSNRLRGIMQERYNNDYRLNKLSSIMSSLREPTVVFIVVIVMLIQVNYIGGGISSIILSLLLFYRGLNYLMALQLDWQNFIRQSGSFRMVSEVSEKMKNYKEETGGTSFTYLKEEIRLKNVCLSFGSNKILENVVIDIPKNSTVAFTGISGSGKTTLVNIISGLLKPDEGKVTVDGLNLADYNLESYRSKIGYISQEPVVFNDTVYNNITFWAEPSLENKKRFWEVVEMASLTKFIEEQDERENTPLGDNGILISGGQRQRISIARELFKRPEILILDEATSALDSETEKVIQDNIEKLHGSYTMIIIAHRLSTVKHADRIYLIEKGKIVNSGKFNDMMEHSTKFKNMVALQGL